jgi:hypothetical protein
LSSVPPSPIPGTISTGLIFIGAILPVVLEEEVELSFVQRSWLLIVIRRSKETIRKINSPWEFSRLSLFEEKKAFLKY